MNNLGEAIGISLFFVGLILFLAFMVKGLLLANQLKDESFCNNTVFTKGIWLLFVPNNQLTEKGQVNRRAAFNYLRLSIYFVLAGIIVSSVSTVLMERYA